MTHDHVAQYPGYCKRVELLSLLGEEKQPKKPVDEVALAREQERREFKEQLCNILQSFLDLPPSERIIKFSVGPTNFSIINETEAIQKLLKHTKGIRPAHPHWYARSSMKDTSQNKTFGNYPFW